jgi:hypothetical protein
VFSLAENFFEATKITTMRGEKTGRVRRRRLFMIASACAVLLVLALQASASQAARGFETGIYEPDFTSRDAATQTLAFDRSVQTRAGFTLIYVDWSLVAPSSRPAGFVPSDPADPRYRWNAVDAAVRDASARGFKILMGVTRAPNWAEGPGRPSQSEAPAGTWKPNPSDLGEFARAIAARYSGNFAGLPAVRYFQLWAEPNLGVNLTPQFEGTTPVGFAVYRPMLDAFYAGVKAASPQSVVVAGGTAPYGGLTPSRGLTFQRMQPLTFWRGLLCQQVSKKKKKKKGKKKGRRATSSAAIPGCTPPRFDVAAHHPINVGGPTRRALNPNDASTPDIGKLRRVLRAGGAGSKPIWATEIWWNSNPPSRGVSLKTQARYLSQAFYLLWKQGVPVAIWFELRDLQPNGSDPIPTCGLFFRDYQAKPAFQAFRFPFAVERLSRSKVRVWGIAPQAGPVSISGRGGRLKTLAAAANRVFVGVLRLRGKARLRATQGSESSLVAPDFVVKKRR